MRQTNEHVSGSTVISMAMTAQQMIEFFREQAEAASVDGMRAAKEKSNYYLAPMNCGDAFKCRLMKGLIEWRTGIDPAASLSEAVQRFADDWASVAAIGGADARLADVPVERVVFAAFLIDRPPPIDVVSDGLEGNRLLDMVLGGALFNSWNKEL